MKLDIHKCLYLYMFLHSQLLVGYLLYNFAIAKCFVDSYFVMRLTMQRFRASNNGRVKCLSCAIVFV